MATQVASLYGVLSLRDAAFKRSMGDARREMSGLSGTLKNVGGQVSSFGNKMTAAFAPVGLALGVAINKTATFDRTMSNVNAILGITGTEAANLRSEILQYGGSTVAGPQAVAEAYYDIVSGVQDASTHMAILEAATATAEAGQADFKATTSGLISVMNAYKFAAEDASFVSDVFTRTVGMGVLTMDELASAFPQVTGLAASMNLSLEEMGGSLAYLTTQGFSASQSATFLKGMITTLLNPTADLSEAITALGYSSGQALLESEGLVGAYQLLNQQNGGLAGLITNQEALQGALALTNENAGAFLTTYNEGIAGATAAAGGIQDQTETWALLSSKLEQLAITAGTTLMPVLLDLLENHIMPIITQVTDWIGQNPELATTILGVAAAGVILGPIISVLGTGITILGTVVGVAQGGIALLSGTMLGAIGAILAVGAAVAAVIAQIQEFNRLTNQAASEANAVVGPMVQSGQISQEELYDQAFKSTSAQFGGGFGGDLMARLFAGQVAAGAATGEFHLVDTRVGAGNYATPGPGYASGGYTGMGPSNQPAGIVHRNEWVVPEGGALVMRGGDSGGGVNIDTMNVYASDAEDFMRQMEQIRRRRG